MFHVRRRASRSSASRARRAAPSSTLGTTSRLIWILGRPVAHLRRGDGGVASDRLSRRCAQKGDSLAMYAPAICGSLTRHKLMGETSQLKVAGGIGMVAAAVGTVLGYLGVGMAV